MKALRAGDQLWMVRVDMNEEIVASQHAFAAPHDARCVSVMGLGGVRDALGAGDPS